MENREKISVVVTGAVGKMGREVVKAISRESDLSLVGAIDHEATGDDAGVVAGIGTIGVAISNSLEEVLKQRKPRVLVDFTRHQSALKNIEASVKNKVSCVIGTTGFTESDLANIRSWSEQNQTPVFIAPNFAIGAVLLMKFAEEASKYFSWSEIIELHHDKKIDAPSGTAIRTAELMLKNRSSFEKTEKEEEKISGVRGGSMQGIRLHSVRLPGLVAHEEVLFGGLGQLLTIRHDSLSRESFMPGVILAIRRVLKSKGLTIGLEHFMS